MYDRLDSEKATPADGNISLMLETFDTAAAHQLWLKALERRETEPEGAITLARTLLETVGKHILDEQRQVYSKRTSNPRSVQREVDQRAAVKFTGILQSAIEDTANQADRPRWKDSSFCFFKRFAQ